MIETLSARLKLTRIFLCMSGRLVENKVNVENIVWIGVVGHSFLKLSLAEVSWRFFLTIKIVFISHYITSPVIFLH